jgi:hypothetical protein
VSSTLRQPHPAATNAAAAQGKKADKASKKKDRAGEEGSIMAPPTKATSTLQDIEQRHKTQGQPIVRQAQCYNGRPPCSDRPNGATSLSGYSLSLTRRNGAKPISKTA